MEKDKLQEKLKQLETDFYVEKSIRADHRKNYFPGMVFLNNDKLDELYYKIELLKELINEVKENGKKTW
jgi:hypothetical protein